MKKTSLVTGGLGGIGKAIVECLLDRGDDVVVFDYQDENSQQVQLLLSKNVRYLKVDISSTASIIAGFEKLFLEGVDIDVLVNNAGVTKDSLAIRLKEADWDKVINVNLKGLFFCCQAAIKHMIKRKKGYIINISSIVGQRGNPGQVNYAASKAGIISLTKTLAMEYGTRNILVNAIAPGFIQTGMTSALPQAVKKQVLERIALKRFGLPSDVASLVLFLTSGDADYITGSVVNVDGGIN